MRKRKLQQPAIIAVVAALIAVFIARDNDNPSDCFTWKVTINESDFYLAGSVHAASKENYPLPKTYLKGYKKADKIIFELADNFTTLEDKIFQYAEKDRLNPDQYLDLHLGVETIEKLQGLFNEEKLRQYCQYEAWLLNMTISGAKTKLIGYDPLLAIDKYFHELAEKDGKDIIGLDSISTQLSLFEFHVPFEMQLKIIEKAVGEMEDKATGEAPLYKAYFSNNLVQFESEFLKPFDFSKPQMKQLYDQVFTVRNTNWVEKFEQLSIESPGTYFVLVGSGHYFGPNNIMELLEQKGYTIEKL